MLKPFLRKLASWPALSRTAQRLSERQKANIAPPPPSHDRNGLPVPSALHMITVSGHADWRHFNWSGDQSMATFAGLVDRNGGDFRTAGKILDFGCGCGRLARHLPTYSDAALYGADYNAMLVDWCREHLPGRYIQNELTPPLELPDASLDIIYSLSVFTHLRLETQRAWLAEFARMLAPGGFCLITFHDEDHESLATTDISRARLIGERIVYFNNQAEGSNRLSTFQTRAQMRDIAGDHFEICDIVPSPQTPVRQAIAVLRKPEKASQDPLSTLSPASPPK